MSSTPSHAPANTPETAADHAAGWQVICLCAEWCGTCREWRPQLARQAQLQPGVDFAWVDIEDEADAIGDLDIETFPTLLIAQGDRARFLGPVLPTAPAIGRLLESLQADPRAGTSPSEAAARPTPIRATGPGPV